MIPNKAYFFLYILLLFLFGCLPVVMCRTFSRCCSSQNHQTPPCTLCTHQGPIRHEPLKVGFKLLPLILCKSCVGGLVWEWGEGEKPKLGLFGVTFFRYLHRLMWLDKAFLNMPGSPEQQSPLFQPPKPVMQF